MDKTKIDWADSTWNPVTGCLHGCEYCYARRMAHRYAGGGNPIDYMSVVNGTGIYVCNHQIFKDNGAKASYPFDFAPTFHRYRLDIPARWKRPRNIFVCSMADLFGEWVPDSWIKEVFAACEKAPQHRYLFLTKNPKRLARMGMAHKVRVWNDLKLDKRHPKTDEYKNVLSLPIRDNWWFGCSLDNKDALHFQGGHTWHTFTSIEPLTQHMNMGIGSFGTDEWTIIGAETGNRKGKIIPKREWVDNIIEAAALTGVRVFMKSSLRDLMGADFRQEYPWEVKP